MSLVVDNKPLKDSIIHAIKSEPVNKVKELIDNFIKDGGSIDFTTSSKGQTPLMISVRTGDIQKVRLILSYNPSINKRDKLGSNVAHHAAGSQSKEMIELLWVNKVDVTGLTHEGYTPAITARHFNNRPVYKRLKQLHPLAHAYSKEFTRRARLAHILELQGETRLAHPSPIRLESSSYSLEGWFPKDFWHILGKRLKAFFDQHPVAVAVDPDAVVELCEQAAAGNPQFERYQKGKPILINSGNVGHHNTILLWNGFAIIADRAGTFERDFFVRQIDPKKVTHQFIEQCSGLKHHPIENYHSLMNKLFEPVLTATQHRITIELTELMQLGQQQAGSCSWANSEAAIYALFVLQGMRHHIKSNITLGEVIKTQKELFEQFRTFAIRYDAEKYLDHHITIPKNAPYYPPEVNFLRLIRPKLPEDLARKVDTLLKR
ncbi:MAG: ankyrin repeat domain-containing protein [Verrucomicrobia bacterium]|nr:ankyrin repeat domain-containing protein [Verrucomicrobiota bacterium]